MTPECDCGGNHSAVNGDTSPGAGHAATCPVRVRFRSPLEPRWKFPPERGLLAAAEAMLARIERTGNLVSTSEYVNLAGAVKEAGGTQSWKGRRGVRMCDCGRGGVCYGCARSAARCPGGA